jgi:hypothetical protein
MKPAAAMPWCLPEVSTKLLGVAVAVLAGSAWPAAAFACQIKPYPDQFLVDATLASASPAPPTAALANMSLRRSQHAPPGNGDCAEIGSLTLQLAQTDGSTWPADVGVRLAVVRGALPQAFEIPSYPLLTTQGVLYFAGGDDPSQPIDFTLQATAVNTGGVESAPIEIRVSEAGHGSGCAIVGRAGRPDVVALAGLALCGLALLRARRGR